MKRTLALFLALAWVCLLWTCAYAQQQDNCCDAPGKGPAMKNAPGNRMNHLKKELGLSDSQVQKLQNMLEKSRQAHKEKRTVLEGKLRAVLTPEQQKIWDSKKGEIAQAGHKKHRARFKEGAPDNSMHSGGMPPQGERRKALKGMIQGLNLSDEQKDRIQAIMDGEKENMKLARGTATKDIRSILTPEQFEKFEALKKDRDGNRERMRERGGKNQ